MTMSAVEARCLFGGIPVNRAVLKEDWLGRKLEWLTEPGHSYWVIEAVGFTALRCIASVVPSVLDSSIFESLCRSGFCLWCSHVALRFFGVHRELNQKVDGLAARLTWQHVFAATALEDLNYTQREGLLSSLGEPLALSSEVQSAYLRVSGIDAKGNACRGYWFKELCKRAVYAEDLSQAPLHTKISREAYAYAVHVEEMVRFMRMKHVVSTSLEFPFNRGLTKGLEISKERFGAIFSVVNRGCLKDFYQHLLDVLKELVDEAAQDCSKKMLFLAAHSLIRSYHSETETEEDLLAYLHNLAFTNELDSLFSITGSAQKLRKNSDGTFLELIEALNTRHALQVFFEWTTLTTMNELILLQEEQSLVRKHYEVLNISIQDGLDVDGEAGALKGRLEKWAQSKPEKEVVLEKSDKPATVSATITEDDWVTDF